MSKKTDIWMPFYVADYLADTQRLTTEQHGAYLLLMLDYWRNGPPPDDDRVLAQITRLSPDAWSNARSMLEQCFDVCSGMWVHGRIEKERVKAKENQQFAEDRARAGAEARWAKERGLKNDASSNASSIHQALLNECTSPSPSPSKESTNVDSKPMSASADVLQVFEHWQLRMSHPGAKLDDKRKKLVIKALKLGYSTVDLIAAIDGCAKSKFHMGDNERGAIYDGLDLILRDGGKIDGFIKINSMPLPENGEFIAMHADKSWREPFMEKHTDTSWAAGLLEEQ